MSPIRFLGRVLGRPAIEPSVGPAAGEPRFAVPAGARIYAVGDVHGRRDLLDIMLDRIAADAAGCGLDVTEVFLGDYIDRGDDSSGVIDRLLAPGPHQRICLRGNHEDMLEAFLEDPNMLTHWAHNGGVQTLASYGVPLQSTGPAAVRDALAAVLPGSHRDFLEGLALTHRAGDVLFVHAGIRPGVPLDRQDPFDLTTIRREFLDNDDGLPVRVVHGHTPQRTAEARPRRVAVDTGAFATGRLSCAVLEGADVRFLVAER